MQNYFSQVVKSAENNNFRIISEEVQMTYGMSLRDGIYNVIKCGQMAHLSAPTLSI